jgi:hypothetical protein
MEVNRLEVIDPLESSAAYQMPRGQTTLPVESDFEFA